MSNKNPSSDLRDRTIAELASLLHAREISAREVTETYLAEISTRDETLGCYLTQTRERALAQADAADARLSAGTDLTPLTGIPIALKDIYLTEGVRTTCASRILEDYIATYDGTAVAKLRAAGTVLLGKLNMDEFAMGSSNEHSAFGPVRNPWNTDYVPGGSSGGSAAAVAAGLAAGTFGTDTGGSIRQPAAHCGVVGIKPTYGRVSRFGVIAFASSLDQVGPLARTVRDAALLLEAVAGHDPHDATSIPAPVPCYADALTGDVNGRIIGLPREYFGEGIDAEVVVAVKKAAAHLEGMGAKIEEISLPHTRYAVPCYYIIAPAEASSNLARYDGIRYGLRVNTGGDLDELYEATRTQGFGPEVRLRIIVGTFVLSSGYYDAYYRKAQQVRTLIKEDFTKAFERCDAILGPVTPTPPFKLNEKIDDPIAMYMSDVLTIPTSLAGLPGMSLPCGISKAGLPIGLQLIGKPLEEATILNIAHAYEQSTEWHRKVPVR